MFLATAAPDIHLRWIVVLLIGLLLLLQYQLWLGDGGIRELRALKRSIEIQNVENEKLRRRNARLEADIEDLKHGLEAVEERARKDLGFVKKGETFFQIIEGKKD